MTEEMTTNVYLRKQLGENMKLTDYMKELNALSKEEKEQLARDAQVEMEARGIKVINRKN